jgi:hypothetical protein
MTLRTNCLPKVRLTSTWGASIPWNQQDDWQRNANSYRCTLHYKGRQYSLDYWQGIGISHDPRADDVLDCLMVDALAGDQTFDDFCADFGYDSDSRKAEKIWRACQLVAKNMKRLLGKDYETFLYADRN